MEAGGSSKLRLRHQQTSQQQKQRSVGHRALIIGVKTSNPTKTILQDEGFPTSSDGRLDVQKKKIPNFYRTFLFIRAGIAQSV